MLFYNGSRVVALMLKVFLEKYITKQRSFTHHALVPAPYSFPGCDVTPGVVLCGCTHHHDGEQYIPLSQKTMSIFSCREIYGDYYLTMALEEQCYTNEHFKYLVVGCICSLLYPLGIPLVYYLILVRFVVPRPVPQSLIADSMFVAACLLAEQGEPKVHEQIVQCSLYSAA